MNPACSAALLTLPMITAESMLLECSVLRLTVVLLFPLNYIRPIYCVLKLCIVVH